MWIDQQGRIVGDAEVYVDVAGTTYLGAFPKAEIAGLAWVTPSPRPDTAPSGWTVDGQPRGGMVVYMIEGRECRVEIVDGVHVQVWNTTPRPELTEAEAAAVAARDLAAQAQAALDASDRTLLRCVETGVTVPPAWTAYRAALRAVVQGGGPLPVRPEYPMGT